MRPAHDPERLIEELYHNANASEGRHLEKRIADLTLWYYRNKRRIPLDNLAARQAFLDQAFWIMIECFALMTERTHDLEAAKRGMSMLWLPKGMKVGGDLGEFG